MIKCSWKSQFGIDCLTCGFQRSFLLLIRGELVESFFTFPATVPFVFLIIFFILHLKYSFKNGARIILTAFIISVFLIVLNYIIKLIRVTHIDVENK